MRCPEAWRARGGQRVDTSRCSVVLPSRSRGTGRQDHGEYDRQEHKRSFLIEGSESRRVRKAYKRHQDIFEGILLPPAGLLSGFETVARSGPQSLLLRGAGPASLPTRSCQLRSCRHRLVPALGRALTASHGRGESSVGRGGSQGPEPRRASWLTTSRPNERAPNCCDTKLQRLRAQQARSNSALRTLTNHHAHTDLLRCHGLLREGSWWPLWWGSLDGMQAFTPLPGRRWLAHPPLCVDAPCRRSEPCL